MVPTVDSLILSEIQVKYHAGDSEFCVGGCSWLWGPWMAPYSCLCVCVCVCVCVSNAASGGKVGECNSYLPARRAQAPTHSCSPYSRSHTQHLSGVCMSVYVWAPARSHTGIDPYFRACERSNLCGASFPVKAQSVKSRFCPPSTLNKVVSFLPENVDFFSVSSLTPLPGNVTRSWIIRAVDCYVWSIH